MTKMANEDWLGYSIRALEFVDGDRTSFSPSIDTSNNIYAEPVEVVIGCVGEPVKICPYHRVEPVFIVRIPPQNEYARAASLYP